MIYFFSRGYVMPRLRNTLISLFALGGLQGAIGWWMVKSGLKDKHQTTELDKTPRVSPYRLTVHAGFAYTLYSICLWQAMNCLRKPQEAFITLKNIQQHNVMRRKLHLAVMAVPLVLITGFFVAGISGGISCNTYPMIGENYFLSKKHFVNGIPLWQNFTENKLVAQVNHRTLATILTMFTSY
jgi:cytochrome c oxidase assembly protein subunit 15